MMIEFDSHTLWVKVKKQEGIGKMKFSLIIGTLNRCRELEICLESLRKQVFRDFEVIIIDQSINDSTQQLANGYQDLNIILLALEVIVGSVVYVVLNILMKNQLMLEVINMTKQRIHNATKKRI